MKKWTYSWFRQVISPHPLFPRHGRDRQGSIEKSSTIRWSAVYNCHLSVSVNISLLSLKQKATALDDELSGCLSHCQSNSIKTLLNLAITNIYSFEKIINGFLQLMNRHSFGENSLLIFNVKQTYKTVIPVQNRDFKGGHRGCSIHVKWSKFHLNMFH